MSRFVSFLVALVTFPIAVTKDQENQLKEGRDYLSLEFENLAHHGGEVMWLKLGLYCWGKDHDQRQLGEERTSVIL